jgi:hypothetical protein
MIYSGVFSNGEFSTHALLDFLLGSITPSLPSAYSILCFYLPMFNIIEY